MGTVGHWRMIGWQSHLFVSVVDQVIQPAQNNCLTKVDVGFRTKKAGCNPKKGQTKKRLNARVLSRPSNWKGHPSTILCAATWFLSGSTLSFSWINGLEVCHQPTRTTTEWRGDLDPRESPWKKKRNLTARCMLLSMMIVAVVSLIWINGRSLLMACGRLSELSSRKTREESPTFVLISLHGREKQRWWAKIGTCIA